MDTSSLIKRELQSLEKELQVLSQVIAKRRQLPLDEIEIRGAALSLASLYNGMEQILKQIVLQRGESLSDTPNWHNALLQKSATLHLISEDTIREMKGFLSFRHFVRHAYSFEINPNAINAILDAAPGLVEQFIAEIQSLNIE